MKAPLQMSQSKQILDHLEQGNSLTPIDALNLFGCFRLSARIGELKQLGHNIKTNIIKQGKKSFASYVMEV